VERGERLKIGIDDERHDSLPWGCLRLGFEAP